MFTLGHTIMQRSNNEVPGLSDPVHDPVDVFNKCIDNQMSCCVTQKRSSVRTLFFFLKCYFSCCAYLNCIVCLWHYLSLSVGSHKDYKELCALPLTLLSAGCLVITGT